MITSFKCKDTQRIWNGETSKKFPCDIQERALNKLSAIDAVEDVWNLLIPPNNHLKRLEGNWFGYMSIRINNQWRICFKWKQGDACDVIICDYH